MLTRASNWRGTAINAIRGTRGLSGARRCGMGADAPDDFSLSDITSAWMPGWSCAGPGLTNCGPNAGTGAGAGLPPAALQVGQLAQSVSSSGQYSINPSTGQLQANMIPGLSNSALLAIGGGLLGLALFMGIARGRR